MPKKVKQFVALMLIITMSLPQMIFATEMLAEDSPWLNQVEILPQSLYTPFPYHLVDAGEQAFAMATHHIIDGAGLLTELPQDELEEFLRRQEEYAMQDWFVVEEAKLLRL